MLELFEVLTTKVIPAGRYAKFSMHRHMEKAITQAWDKIWSMNLDRSFTVDFEIADIDVYTALK